MTIYEYADYKVYSKGMWMNKGQIYIEFSVDIEEDYFE